MPSRSLRRTVAALSLAALLLPISTLHAAQRQSRPAPANSARPANPPSPATPANTASNLSPILGAIVQFFIDAGMQIDGNG
jgi:hypothetical protein